MRSGRPCVVGAVQAALPLAFDLEKSRDMVGARRTARASRAHPTSSWNWSRIGMGLLCAQNVVKCASGCSHVTLSTWRPLPAYSRRLVSLQILHVPCAMHARCTRPAGSSRLASGKPRPVARARFTMVIDDLIEVAAPNGLRMQLVALNAPGVSCIPADPRAPGRTSATAVALSSDT
jgi:hypothetical protein